MWQLELTRRKPEPTRRHLNERRLAIDDPFSGKTILPRHFVLKFLEGKHSELGFNEEIHPVFDSLQNLEFINE